MIEFLALALIFGACTGGAIATLRKRHRGRS